jgi:2,4-dienoyl-CoA reductase-like NADH-dependent reductase (Old Yellow Enzyme family)/thioredoxin reductase
MLSGSTPSAPTGAFEHLLSPGRIGSLELRNRIVMSPMGSNLCESDGHLGERILRYYEERARGGVGMLIVGVAAITWPDGACNPNQVAISSDAFLPGLRELARRAHAHGARAAIQLQHAGKVAVRDIVAGRPMWVPSIPDYKAGDLTSELTPDEMQSFVGGLRSKSARVAFREMDADDVAYLVARFAEAAERAQRAGFDGVELHAGHGYILSEFLSPASNRREDEYGGSIENRARFLVETIQAVKNRVGADFPVWCRIDGTEYRTPGGISPEDAQRAAELAEAAGADAIHVSAYADSTIGAAFTEAPLVHQPCGFVEHAEGVKRRVGVPVIAVGRIEPEEAEALIERGGADFVAMARKLLADPELPNKLAAGRRDAVRPCIYCYTCVGRIFLNRESACAVNARSGLEFEIEDPVAMPAATARSVLVVGGGPAGLEVARVAALRGHRVTLCERGPALGGALRISGHVNPPNARLLEWLEGQVRELGVELRTGTEVGVDGVESFGADVVVVAAGAQKPRGDSPVSTPGSSWGVADWVDADGKLREPGERVVVLGGGGVGLSVADHWSERGRQTTVLEESAGFGSQLSPPRRWRLLAALRERGVTLHRNVEVIDQQAGRIRFRVPEMDEQELAFDNLLLTGGWQPDRSLAEPIAARGVEVHLVGDCRELGLVEGALKDAGAVGRSI